MPDELQIAWAAGLFEGEGTITCRPGARGQRAEARVSMSDQDVIDRLHKIVGVGTVIARDGAKPGHKKMYTWRVGAARDVEFVLNLFLPYLGKRRTARAVETIALTDTMAREKTHCLRGHPLSGANLYLVPGKGWKRCKACQYVSSKRSYERRLQGARLEETGG